MAVEALVSGGDSGILLREIRDHRRDMAVRRETSVKRCILVVLAVAALSAQTAYALDLGDPADTPLGQQYRAELQVLTVPPTLLPASCRLLREIRTAPIFPATTNPFVTDDAALIRFVSSVGFGTETISEVSVAMSALYSDAQPQHEVGVWVLKFRSPEAAATAVDAWSTGDVLVRDSMVATVWRDDDTARACQSAIEAHLVKNGFTRRSAKR